MLRAVPLPGQAISRLSLRVQAVSCRPSPTRRFFLSQSCETDVSHERSDPVQFPHPSHAHLGRFQNDGSVSTGRRKTPRTSGTRQRSGSGTTGDVRDSAKRSPTSNQASSHSPSPVGLPPPRVVKLTYLTRYLESLRSERDVRKAWGIYRKLEKRLSSENRSGGDMKLVYTSLHRLVRLLSTTTPRTRIACSRILKVLCTLQQLGGRIYKWELHLAQVILEEGKLDSWSHERLRHLVANTSPSLDSTVPNRSVPSTTPVSGSEVSPLSGVSPEGLPEIDYSNKPQLPILVAPIPSTFPHLHERARLLNIIGETQSFDEAWDAYHAFPLQPLAEDPTLNSYPSRHLHRLASLLATIRPRTRKVYLSLVSILSTLHASGHLISPWEWNFLIDASAKGWRKTRFEDYQTSLRVFNDMLAYRGEILESDSSPHTNKNVRAPPDEESISTHDNLAPDVYSYTTLISHAARTLSPQAIEHARSLLNASGIIPNGVTLLAQLHFHTYHNQMYGVRRTIAEIRDKSFALDICGINSIVWAFSRNEHVDVAEAVYRILRNNAENGGSYDSMVDGVDEGIATAVKFLDEMENIVIPPMVVPDRITYTILIQSYAYQGDLTRSLQVLADMLSSPDPLATWRGEVGAAARFTPALEIFRALFLGFFRHGVGPLESGLQHHRRHDSRRNDERGLDWNLDNLDTVFKWFLELPADRKPVNRVVYWLIMAFEKCSGGNKSKMREVWTTLEDRWGDQWATRLRRVRTTAFENAAQAEVTSSSHEGDR